MRLSRYALGLLALTGLSEVRAADPTPGTSSGAGVRYATDAYPGFDSEKEIVSPERKTPRWFSFWLGPDRGDAKSQFEYCNGLLAAGDVSKACRQLDALVREWPTAPEAAKAQRLLADTRLTKQLDYEAAFADYRYLLDFYSLQCDYDEVANQLYQVAGLLKAEGKEVMFVRFENTVDVRRAYEACVLHAPGAKWASEAMLTIAGLREREGKFAEAVKVYENLRSLYPDTPEAKQAILREAEVRMRLVEEYGYNRSRCQDTVGFLRQALLECGSGETDKIKALLDRVLAHCEDEDYQRAKFYDSTTRTVRSAINAYEKFLLEHPHGTYAEQVRKRLDELKGGGK